MCVENSVILDEIVRVANEAADAAGMVVKKYFGNPQLIQSFDKHDKDGCIVEQTTTADLAAEDAMVSVILHNFQDHLVFGEERGWSSEARDADYVWVLDPIDGTTSFKNGIPLFGTLIALLYKSKPIVGIIDQPILQRRWVGVQGRRTTMDGLPVQTRHCQQLSQATLYASSPLHFSDEERVDFYRVFKLLTNLVRPIIMNQLSNWRPPQKGFVKLNVDGRWNGVAISGAGGVIRDADGAWVIGFSSSFNAGSALAAELRAIKEGLTLAKDQNFKLVEIETDAKEAKELLDSFDDHPTHELAALLVDVGNLLSNKDWVVALFHAPRSANVVADKLAHFANGMSSNFMIHLEMPVCVASAIRRDMGHALSFAFPDPAATSSGTEATTSYAAVP